MTKNSGGNVPSIAAWMTRDLLTSIAIWKWHSSKDVLSFLELISSNYFKIWMNFNYSLVLTNNPFYQYLLTTVFVKSKQRFFSLYHGKGSLRLTCSTSFICLCLAGPDLNQMYARAAGVRWHYRDMKNS